MIEKGTGYLTRSLARLWLGAKIRSNWWFKTQHDGLPESLARMHA
jgi:hypothetical protein